MSRNNQTNGGAGKGRRGGAAEGEYILMGVKQEQAKMEVRGTSSLTPVCRMQVCTRRMSRSKNTSAPPVSTSDVLCTSAAGNIEQITSQT